MNQYITIKLPHFHHVINDNPENFNFLRIKIVKNSNNMLHAILRTTSITYNDEEMVIKNNDGMEQVIRIDRESFTNSERLKLADMLSFNIDNDPSSPTYYDMISKKSLFSSLSNKMPNIPSLSQMKHILMDLTLPLGIVFLSFLSLVYNVNIYVLHYITLDIYQAFINNKSGRSMVLMLDNDNFVDVIGIRYDMGILSIFDNKDPFVKSLNKRYENLRSFDK